MTTTPRANATLTLAGKAHEFPTFEGSEGEYAVDMTKLRSLTGYVSYDESYGNTGSCLSTISFIDGEKGILRHRGYPIEQLAANSRFLETAYLIVYGELPTQEQFAAFSEVARKRSRVDDHIKKAVKQYPQEGHPMCILSSLISGLACYYPDLLTNTKEQDLEHLDEAAAKLISKVRTLAAMIYRHKQGLEFVEARDDLRYSANFLYMMFGEEPKEAVTDALDMIFLLHADHEQNCSTSTVRMVASSEANLFACVSAGVNALWGPLHGGANMKVIAMLEEIHKSGDDGTQFIKDAKDKKAKLMGFGHRVYKNFDPRATILKKACDDMLKAMGKKDDPLLDIAKRLEKAALEDEYFISRKLYPNVDFYSGIILKAIGLPMDMFTVIFAIGRMAGWIANWKEVAENPKGRIYRPRQIYTGPTVRDYVPLDKRG